MDTPELGFAQPRITLVDHHAAHAAAAFCSGFDTALVITIDGIGDGLSGSIWSLRDGKMSLLAELDGKASLGIFFEHVTNLLNMRELEDEGKVMALASYAYPVPDNENRLLGFFRVQGMKLLAQYSSARMYKELSRILWHYPAEQFANMAQRAVEIWVSELVKSCLAETGHQRLVYAGGVASNVKVNMRLQELEQVKELSVFPHMGDGGLAVGAALWENYLTSGTSRYLVDNVLWGPSYSEEQIRQVLSSSSVCQGTRVSDPAGVAADLLLKGEIIMWFQGRMEFGPRALGGRSILALPNSPAIKDELNLKLKRRGWYQPFCPVMLEQDARSLLINYDGRPELFMTCAYQTRPEKRYLIAGVVGIDGSCRPQIVPENCKSEYAALLRKVREATGTGALLNTSFNLHGQPMVCSPEDALETFVRTEVSSMVLGDFLVSKRPSRLEAGGDQ